MGAGRPAAPPHPFQTALTPPGLETPALMSLHCTTIAILGFAALAAPAWAAEEWQQQIATGLGKSGSEMPGGVYRVGLPRSDLKVVLDGVELKPAFALGSWLAFKRMGNDVVVMGDLVLTDDEVNLVMKRLVENGIEITALHNHLLGSQPRTMYMHVSGHGEPGKLAATLREALSQSKTPLGAGPAGAVPQTTTTQARAPLRQARDLSLPPRRAPIGRSASTRSPLTKRSGARARAKVNG